MATVLSTLYPPLIDTFMPAFPNVESAEVHFTVSPYNSSYDIRYLHVTLVNQKTNKNAFNTEANINTPAGTALINGIWIIPFSESLNGDINPYLSLDREANYYTLYIPPSLLKSNGQTNEVPTFLTNGYYKLQLRFDKYSAASSNWNITEATSSYISEKRAFFSEWSSVCLLKAIPEISVHFNNFTQELDNYLQQNSLSITNLGSNFTVPERVPQYMPGIIPFAGNLTFAGDVSSGIASSTGSEYYNKDIRTTSNDEYLMSYQIVVKDNLDNVVKDSKVQYPSRNEKTNNFYWLCDMTSATTDVEYKVTLTFTTNNQYTFSKDFSFFLIPPSNLSFNPTISFNKIPLFEYGTEKETLVTCEDGWVEITVKNNDIVGSGYLFIKRATSLTNFTEWDLIDCYYISDGDNFQRTIIDKTISSLVSYKYSCQFLTSKGSWTRTVISSEIVYPDFHDILLSRGDKQLAIRYNGQIASMTPVVNRVKIDTLGGRYPKFAENAKLHYKQFQLSGLITAESDFNRTFLNDLDYDDEMEAYNDHMNGKYMVRNDTVLEPDILYGIDEKGEVYSKTNGTYSYNVEAAEGSVEGSIDRHIRDTQKNTKHDLYPKDNWWWERKFREEVVEWLNDGEPKLYRSMTEGNLIVMLDSISLTPNAQLGRRIWNFSCTVYEVGDGNSLEQLDSFGIFPVVNNYSANLVSSSSEQGISTSEINRSSLGQISGVTANVDGPTKLINLGEQDPRYFDTVINSEGQTLSVKALSIGEQISNLYDGLYENYSFDSNSIRLKDLKIQFESLPQWYDLDSMSPEGTLDGGLYLTLSDDEGLNQLYKITRDNQNKLVITAENPNPPLWFRKDMSISDFIIEWENANGRIYHNLHVGTNDYYVSQKEYETKYYKVKEEYVNTYNLGDYISKADVFANIYNQNPDIAEITDEVLSNSNYLLKNETSADTVALLTDVIDLKEYIHIREADIYIEDPGDNLEDYIAWGPGNNLIKVDTKTGEARTIIGSGNVEEIVEALVWQVDENDKIIARNNYGLGYKLKLNLISPYDSSVQLERTIFVNQRGYYQVPSNMVVKEITLFDGAKASLNYTIEYDLTYDDVTEPNTYEVAENIVGQISGDWAVNTSITPLVQAKYWAYDKQDSVITQQTLDYWKAISFDGTPYTVLYIQPTNQLNSIQYIVGRSGVLNLQTDYPTANLSIQGKRMVKAPISRQDYLDEWEYVLDESVYGGKQDEDTGFGTYWWILYNNQSSSETDIVVKVQYFNDSFEEISWDDLREVADTWYQLGREYYSSTEILTPKPNTVYGIINTLGMIEYKIYYLDQGWFTVEFPNAAEGDYSIAYARVPVYGMINYQAAITKKVWN